MNTTSKLNQAISFYDSYFFLLQLKSNYFSIIFLNLSNPIERKNRQLMTNKHKLSDVINIQFCSDTWLTVATIAI